MKLTTIVVNWNRSQLLAACLAALCRVAGPPQVGDDAVIPDHEIIVVDNGSTDGSAELVGARFPQITLLRNPQNRYFTAANNQGLRRARIACRGAPWAQVGDDDEYVLLLNNDVVLQAGCLAQMVRQLEQRPDLAGVAPMLLNAEGETLATCMRFPTLQTACFYQTTLGRLFPHHRALTSYYMNGWDHQDTRLVDQPPAACFLLRRAILDQLGPLDESMVLYFSDVDLCKRMKMAGYKILYLARSPRRSSCGDQHHASAQCGRVVPPGSLGLLSQTSWPYGRPRLQVGYARSCRLGSASRISACRLGPPLALFMKNLGSALWKGLTS